MVAESGLGYTILEGGALILATLYCVVVVIPWIMRIIEGRAESLYEGIHDDLHENELYEHFHDYEGDDDLNPQENEDEQES